MFVQIETDAGVTGIGEDMLKGKARTIAAEIADALGASWGRCPLDPEWIWNLVYESDRYRGGPILTRVMSAIDMACWDILGKVHEKQVRQLLGNPYRDTVQLYGRLCKPGTPE